jgi:Flp pilus assembly pilin Flp
MARVRSGASERGASAVEWVVISMIVVGICIAVGVILSTALSGKANQVSSCIAGATNTSSGCGSGSGSGSGSGGGAGGGGGGGGGGGH